MGDSVCNLNTYKYHPTGDFTISEIKKVCYERLVLYKILLEAKQQHLKPSRKAWIDYVKKEILQKNLYTYIQLVGGENNPDLQKSRHKDHIAHWILSLCEKVVNITLNMIFKL